MEHVDAKAIRERLNSIVLAMATLEGTATAAQMEAIASARGAVREIALLVTGDEAEEHGQYPPARLRMARAQIRQEETAEAAAGDGKPADAQRQAERE